LVRFQALDAPSGQKKNERKQVEQNEQEEKKVGGANGYFNRRGFFQTDKLK